MLKDKREQKYNFQKFFSLSYTAVYTSNSQTDIKNVTTTIITIPN